MAVAVVGLDYGAIFDASPQACLVLDRACRIVAANQACQALISGPSTALVGRAAWEAFDTGREAIVQSVETVLRTRAAHTMAPLPRWQITHTPILDADGEVMLVTQHVSAPEDEREGRRKDEFLAMLAHELRNPLAPIAAAADLLRLCRCDEARVRETSTIIARQTRHMTALIDDLLDVSRVTRGLAALDKAELDIKLVMSNAVEQLRPLIAERRHKMAIHLPSDYACVMGDHKRLVQVIVNLLDNAAKYTPEGGCIAATVTVSEAMVTLRIEDTGIGMTPELAARAFDLFAQAQRAPDRSQGGLGVGLALVRSLVELHGGSVTVHSAGPGQGSTFTVELPRVRGDHAGRGAGSDAGLAAGSRPLKVLIVDDNVDAASMLAMLVEMMGHQVFVEFSSRLALERAEREVPDVCLLDIGLPEMDGNELARRISACTPCKPARMVAVTGYGKQDEGGAAIDAAFGHHLVKPVAAASLAGLLKTMGAAPENAPART